jgi:hypothetical protein
MDKINPPLLLPFQQPDRPNAQFRPRSVSPLFTKRNSIAIEFQNAIGEWTQYQSLQIDRVPKYLTYQSAGNCPIDSVVPA